MKKEGKKKTFRNFLVSNQIDFLVFIFYKISNNRFCLFVVISFLDKEFNFVSNETQLNIFVSISCKFVFERDIKISWINNRKMVLIRRKLFNLDLELLENVKKSHFSHFMLKFYSN